MSLTVIGSELALFEVSDDGFVTSEVVPGVQSHEEGEGTLNQRQVKAFEGSASKLGLPDVAPITVAALANPAHPAWVTIIAAGRTGAERNFRLTTREQVHFASPASVLSQTAAIATTGAVTFSGLVQPDFSPGQTRFAPGMSLELASQSTVFIIESISSAGAVVVFPKPGSAIAASAGYSIRTPRMRAAYDAVPSKPGISLANEGDLQFSLTLYPRTLTPDWEPIKTQT